MRGTVGFQGSWADPTGLTDLHLGTLSLTRGVCVSRVPLRPPASIWERCLTRNGRSRERRLRGWNNLPAYSLKGFKHSQFAGRQPRCNSQMPAAEPEYLRPVQTRQGTLPGKGSGQGSRAFRFFFFFFSCSQHFTTFMIKQS